MDGNSLVYCLYCDHTTPRWGTHGHIPRQIRLQLYHNAKHTSLTLYFNTFLNWIVHKTPYSYSPSNFICGPYAPRWGMHGHISRQIRLLLYQNAKHTSLTLYFNTFLNWIVHKTPYSYSSSNFICGPYAPRWGMHRGEECMVIYITKSGCYCTILQRINIDFIL